MRQTSPTGPISGPAPVLPLNSASKARWLLEHIPHGLQRAENGELCLGTVDSWILWNLTGGAVHACDASNAARTQLLNIKSVAGDPELMEIYGVPAAGLPKVMPSSARSTERQ